MRWRRPKKPATVSDLHPWIRGVFEGSWVESEIFEPVQDAVSKRGAIRRLEGKELVSSLAIAARLRASDYPDRSDDPVVQEGLELMERWLADGSVSDEDILRAGTALDAEYWAGKSRIEDVTQGKHTLKPQDERVLNRLEPKQSAVTTLIQAIGGIAFSRRLVAPWAPNTLEDTERLLRFSGQRAGWAIRGQPDRALELISQMIPVCYE